MDLDTKLWMYSPTSAYLLNEDHTTIVEWRDDSISAPTQADLDQAEADYLAAAADPIQIASDKTQIAGDGQDTATITVTYALPWPPAIEVLVNGAATPVALTDGVGTLELVSDAPGTTILVESNDGYQGVSADASASVEVV